MSYGYDIAFTTVYRLGDKYYKAPPNEASVRLQAVSIDDVAYLITPVVLVDDVRARALNKLTPEERDALGVK